MALTFKQAQQSSVASAVTSLAQTWSSATTTGSFLICFCLWSGTGSPVLTVTDTTSGNVWQQIGTNNVQGNTVAIFAVPLNALGQGSTVTMHATISGILVLSIAEYTGQATSTPIDAFAQYFNASTSLVTMGPISGNFTNEQYICYAWAGNGTAPTPSAGYTSRLTVGSPVARLMDAFFAAGSLNTGGWTENAGPEPVQGFIVSVKTTTSIAVAGGGNSGGGLLKLLGVN
jgi:hypothetical protein